ncbi:MAG: DUF192 domain-containing protein [Natronomonas sp.]|nr:DUF192 domain-containing protein [Natronomonas sp.]
MTTSTPTLRHPKTGVQQPVERLNSLAGQTRGAIGRGVGSGLWFDFDGGAKRRWLHMVGVREPLGALWIDGDELVRTATLRPWVGVEVGRATDVVEVPVDAPILDVVEPGDEVVLA